MKIVWDERKRLINLAKHGFGFAEIDASFFEIATLLSARGGRISGHRTAGTKSRLGRDSAARHRVRLDHLDAARQPKGAQAMTAKWTPPPLSDEEEAEIQRQIASDPDTWEATDEELAQGRPFAEVFPDLMESIRRDRGRPRSGEARQPVTLRLSPATLERFRSAGADWRKRMAEVLEKAAP
jgi:uncharacterized protein (DUF4415 family)